MQTDRKQPATKDELIAPEAKQLPKKSTGMTRKGFGQLLKRAFTQQAPKAAPKLP
jgi:hypothetical protein